MATSHICATKTHPRGKCPRAARQGTKSEVTLNQSTCVTLTLPTIMIQELFIVITSELKRLRQQLKQTAEDKKLVKATPAECVLPRNIRSRVKQKITQGERRPKQTAHKSKVKPTIVYGPCQTKKEDCLPNSFFRASNYVSKVTCPFPAVIPEAVNGNVNNQMRPQIQPAETAIDSSVGGEKSTQDRHCLFCPPAKIVTVNNCETQTLPTTETKGVNTKLKVRQTRVEQAEQVVKLRKTVQRGEKPIKDRVPAVQTKRSAKQEQLAVTAELEQTVEKEKVEASTEHVIKVPQNSNDLLQCTLDIITELMDNGVIKKPDQLRNVCVFCQDKHRFAICKKLQDRIDFDRKYRPSCYICKENHHIDECEWLQVLELIHSLTSSEQHMLLEVCPHLEVTIKNPTKYLGYMFWWRDMKEVVNNTISKLLTLGTEDRVQKARAVIKPSDPSVTEIKLLETIPVPASSKYRNKTKVRSQEGRQCHWCHSETHFLRECIRYKQRKVKQKTMSGKKITMNEQDVVNRSTTKKKLGVVQAVTQPSEVPTRSEQVQTRTVSTAAQQEEKKDKLATAYSKEVVDSAVVKKTTAIAKSTEHSVVEKVPIKEQVHQNVPKNSAELAALIDSKLFYLSISKDIMPELYKGDFCVYCRTKKHKYSQCQLLNEVNVELKNSREECIICASKHELKTCKWLKILDKVHSLNKKSQERVIQWCPAVKNSLDKPEENIFYQFTWPKVKSTVEEVNWDILGIKHDKPLK